MMRSRQFAPGSSTEQFDPGSSADGESAVVRGAIATRREESAARSEPT